MQGSLRKIAIEWLILAALGITMALISLAVDTVMFVIGLSHHIHWDTVRHIVSYLLWIMCTVAIIAAACVSVQRISPDAMGSGIPEMKTILRGLILKDYLSCRTLLATLVGLTFALASALPIGKAGPFVHVASIIANQLSKFAAKMPSVYANECQRSEMFAAACAVGMASTFSAPIGGVLFSIEVTTTYFSVSNYWRGFFAAACGAAVFRLLRLFVFKTEGCYYQLKQTYSINKGRSNMKWNNMFSFDNQLPSYIPVVLIRGKLPILLNLKVSKGNEACRKICVSCSCYFVVEVIFKSGN
ncbi:unnamed protein product [Anisakis simplex]|uniref:Chloride channel protein n=1 Tax=Anisakis simplex TaxID=6269 RepID=A0A0M3K709_ANISI|nr:unnamed protein product [Anisakis simplex]